MSKKRKKDKGREQKPSPEDGPAPSLDPEQRLCAKFDSTGIAKFPVASREQMGVRVLDNCAEEHIM